MDTSKAIVVVFEGVWGTSLQDLARHRVVVRLDEPHLPDEADWLEDVATVVVRNRTQVTDSFLTAMPNLRIVARAGVGLDNIDLDAAIERDVAVVSPRGANATSVAEHTLGLALAVARSVVTLDLSTRAGQWDRQPGMELSGQTWGLLGAGATGRATGERAGALGMKVLAYDPYASREDLAPSGIEKADLHTVVARSQVLSCHLPAVAETVGLVDAALLAQMPQGSIFVNTGRGEVVVEDDLAAAVASGHLRGAGLDVRAQEPPAPGPFDGLNQVILTPHIAGITEQSQHAILAALATDIDHVLNGRAPVHDVRFR